MGHKERVRWVAFHMPYMHESSIQEVLTVVRKLEAGDIVNTLRSGKEVDAQIWTAVCHYLRHSAGYPDMTPEQYQSYVRHDGQHAVAHEISATVRDFVRTALDAALPTGVEWLVELIKDGFAFEDEELWDEIALHYVPGVFTFAFETGQEWE